MKNEVDPMKKSVDRRSFVKKSLAATGAATLGAGLINSSSVFAEDKSGPITKGDIAILRFLAAAEIIETDLWQQYNELGGIQDSEVPGGSGSEAYTEALEAIDDDMPDYIHDNTDDEFTHFDFINAYLASKGAEPVNLDRFRTLPSSQATGAQQIGRLTNLMQLTVDTSWYTRYRIDDKNPDLDPSFVFPQAVESLSKGQFPAIPRNDADLAPNDHIQAIANTAAFHFAFIEQGGTSLYPSLAQRVSNLEVLRILLSIGPTETAHFQIWHDQVGNAPPLTDPTNPDLVFPDLNAPPLGGETYETSLIMPEPCPFLSRKFPRCSIVRPTNAKGAAMGAVKALTADGLFIGQSQEFFNFLTSLAAAADAAQRNF
ncbi:MAG TPA: ferritin-like domain-containing protein [Terriglobales bacterium]|nr:ferritin-like domain-containing protein [Terriglobales bacterium]